MGNKFFSHVSEVDPEQYEFLLFDLGGVMFNIDPEQAYNSFLNLPSRAGASMPPFASFFGHPLFWELEVGKISESEFLSRAAETFGLLAGPEELTRVFNRVLLGVEPLALEVIPELAQRFPLYLLSNSNRIHFAALVDECEPLFTKFRELYFSFDLHLHKPDPSIYLKAAELGGFAPSRTLFIDDSRANAEGAVKAGMDSLHWVPGVEKRFWWDSLKNWKLAKAL